jgi:hypothetical protein
VRSRNHLNSGLNPPPSGPSVDDLGIRYEGPVLSGLVGARQQLRNQASASSQTSTQIRELSPGGASYLPNPALLHPSHDSRLQPDPLRDAQRSRLGGRHDLCDPVLRAHTGLPPLPDPYEEQRRRQETWPKVRDRHILP